MEMNKVCRPAILVLVSVALLMGACRSGPQGAQSSAEVQRALGWLRTQQLDDGSFNAGFGHPAGVTCDAVLAVAATGADPAAWRSAEGKPSLMDYLAANAAGYAVDAGSTAKLVVTVVAAGLDPRAWAGKDWVALLKTLQNQPGVFDPSSPGQAWAILALAAAGEIVPASAVTTLKAYQLETGAWPSAFGPDTDTVGYVLQALAAAGEPKDSPSIAKALEFLQSQQNDDGGFPAIKPSEWGTDTNANSTASVIMGLIAVGADPQARQWTRTGGSPLAAMLHLQASDGRIEFQPGTGSALMATVQAIPALMRKNLPFHVAR
jgi:iron complex transport system substrate-binding protein